MDTSLLIWDFNGTLLDDTWLIVEVNNQMNLERGLAPMSLEYYREHFTHPPKPFYTELGYDWEKETYAQVSREFMDRYEERRNEVSLTDHALEVLEWAKNHHLPQIILSAHNQQRLEEQLERLGILSYFEKVSGNSDLVITGKVQRGIELSKTLSYDFSKAVVIGDTSHDCETAQAMGCQCILYSGGQGCGEKLRACSSCVVSSLAEIPSLLESTIDKGANHHGNH